MNMILKFALPFLAVALIAAAPAAVRAAMLEDDQYDVP